MARRYTIPYSRTPSGLLWWRTSAAIPPVSKEQYLKRCWTELTATVLGTHFQNRALSASVLLARLIADVFVYNQPLAGKNRSRAWPLPSGSRLSRRSGFSLTLPLGNLQSPHGNGRPWGRLPRVAGRLLYHRGVHKHDRGVRPGVLLSSRIDRAWASKLDMVEHIL